MHVTYGDLQMLMQEILKDCKIEQPKSYVNKIDIINYRGIDSVRESISQRINYFVYVLVFNCSHGNAPRDLSESIAMASHMHDRNTRLNMSSDVNVPLGRTY